MSAPPADVKARCPLCGKPAARDHQPFCSAACQDRDLIAWLDEAYALPGPLLPDGEPDQHG